MCAPKSGLRARTRSMVKGGGEEKGEGGGQRLAAPILREGGEEVPL